MRVERRRLLAYGAAALVVLALAAPKLMSAGGEEPRAGARGGGGGSGRGGPGGGTAVVEATVVRPQPLGDRLSATGSMLAGESVTLQAEEAGRVTGIHFREGSRVQRGQLLVKLNDAELRAELQRAQARAQLAAANAARAEQLHEQELTSREEYDRARSETAVARADLALMRARLAQTEIRAPFSGVIGLRQVSVGSYVSTATPIATLNQLDPMRVEFTVPEGVADRVEPGDAVQFTVAGVPRPFTARVYATEGAIDAGTRTLRVRARAANPDGQLRPGAFAEVQVALDEQPDALVVPALAIVPGAQGSTVFVVRGGKAEVRAVETGLRTPAGVEVRSGLAPGDTVVVSGVQAVRPGGAVRVAAIR